MALPLFWLMPAAVSALTAASVMAADADTVEIVPDAVWQSSFTVWEVDQGKFVTERQLLKPYFADGYCRTNSLTLHYYVTSGSPSEYLISTSAMAAPDIGEANCSEGMDRREFFGSGKQLSSSVLDTLVPNLLSAFDSVSAANVVDNEDLAALEACELSLPRDLQSVMSGNKLGSGLIDHSQKMTVAAIAMAEK